MYPNKLRINLFSIIFLLIVFVNLNTLVGSENPNNDHESHNSIYPSFTDKEKVSMKKFREMMGPYLYHNYMREDQYLIRWIRDSNFDLTAAKQKLMKALEWRKQNKIDGILEEDFSSLIRNCPFNIQGHDKIGRPIGTLSIGTCDLRKLVLAGDLPRFQRFMYYVLELAANTVREIFKSGNDIRDGLMIIDVNGFNLRQHGCIRCIPMAFALLEAYETYYPYYLHKVILINVPRIAIPFIDLGIPALSPRSKEIYKIYGFDRNEWEKDIRKIIDPDQLPQKYGGLKQ